MARMIARPPPADDNQSLHKCANFMHQEALAACRASQPAGPTFVVKASTMRSRPEEKKLEILSTIDSAVDRAVQSAILKPYLADKHFRVVCKAATLTGERALPDLTPDLLTAYGRFLEDPVKRDPNCMAKGAIARALVNLGCDDVDFYLAGIRYTQLEPVWGGSADTAIDVRCSCALGLVNTRYSRAIQELTTLLHDREARARAGAARAISCGSSREAEAVLRLKVLVGDAESEVIGECFHRHHEYCAARVFAVCCWPSVERERGRP